jgi:uncharacterized secreted protein with C-terminal beta-propeller domain
VPDDRSTEVHRFELTDGDTTTYRGSARVPGFLLSQFSMSEAGGVLRVASTDRPPWFGDGSQEPSQSYVTTFGVADGAPQRLGQVGGLGRGERIYAVRFLGDVGYVVTFRQTDPLYTVDVSRPAAPRVRGELQLLGYSAYLHPVGDGRVLGVGQDATEQGRTLGTQVSLFDVSDLDAPKLLQRATVGGGSSSAVEWDHHAFLWWPPTRLALLPVTIWREVGTPVGGPQGTTAFSQAFVGAVGFTVADGGIEEAGRISHDQGQPYARPITRSLVVGDRVYTLSDAGLGVNRLDTLAPVSFVAFG